MWSKEAENHFLLPDYQFDKKFMWRIYLIRKLMPLLKFWIYSYILTLLGDSCEGNDMMMVRLTLNLKDFTT